MFVMVTRCWALSMRRAGPVNSKMRSFPPRTVSRRSSSRMTSLAVHQGCRAPASRTATICGIKVVRPAAHRQRHVHPSGADGDHRHPAAVGGVAVGAQYGLAGDRKVFQVDLVPNAGGRFAEPDAVLAGRRLQVEMVLHVLGLDVQDVVVGVAGGDPAADAGDAHRLEMQKGLRGGEILSQDLVDPDANLFSSDEAAFDEVRFEDLAGQVLAHWSTPPSKLYRECSCITR